MTGVQTAWRAGERFTDGCERGQSHFGIRTGGSKAALTGTLDLRYHDTLFCYDLRAS